MPGRTIDGRVAKFGQINPSGTVSNVGAAAVVVAVLWRPHRPHRSKEQPPETTYYILFAQTFLLYLFVYIKNVF